MNTGAQEPATAVAIGKIGDGFRVSLEADGHRLTGDEPVKQGGTNEGPSPYDFLSAALASCTVMTLNMYARRKEIPLESVQVSVWHDKIHATDCAECDTRTGMMDRLEKEIVLKGTLSAEQRDRLMEIADRCPVHRTLQGEIQIISRLSGT